MYVPVGLNNNNNKRVIELNNVICQLSNLISDMKNTGNTRVVNPNILAPTILMIEKSILKIEEGIDIEDDVDLIESDIRSIMLV